MQKIVVVLFVIHIAAPTSFAQIPERVRVDLFIGAGATAFQTFVPPSRFVPADAVPTDALAMVQPTLFVSVTSRIQAGVDLPFAVAFNPAAPQAGLRYGRGGIGDIRLFATAVVVAERRLGPSVQFVGSGSMETATLPHLAAPRGMGGRVMLHKTLHPRVRIAGSFGYSDNLQEPTRATLEPFRTLGGLMELGVSRTSLMSVWIEEVAGGARRVDDRQLPGVRDLQAGISLTRYNEGRPRISLVVTAFGLRRRDPFVLIGVRFAALSLGKPAD